jgi:hypothetical protein
VGDGSWHYVCPPITPPATNVTTLTEGVWANDNLPHNVEHLFKFTATITGYQWFHVSLGTLTDVHMTVYSLDGKGIDSDYSNGTKVLMLASVTSGETYYLWIRPLSANGSGTYKIAFNQSSTPPIITLPTANDTTLTEGEWANGNTLNGEQWFKFTATVTGAQYIHVSFGTSIYLNVQTYNSNVTALGDWTIFYGSNTRTSLTVTSGETYYIRVWPHTAVSSTNGTYKIAFNQSSTAPAQ